MGRPYTEWDENELKQLEEMKGRSGYTYNNQNIIIHWYDVDDNLVVLMDDQDTFRICTENMWEYDIFFKNMSYIEHINPYHEGENNNDTHPHQFL